MDPISTDIFIISRVNDTEFYRIGTGNQTSHANGYNNETILPENLEIPSQIDNKTIIEIGNSAFVFTSEIRTVHLPYTIQKLDEDAFAHCPNLEYINIPAACTFIGYRAIHCYCYANETNECKKKHI